MEYDYDDIQVYIDRANHMRSEAMGQLLGAGWKKCVQFIERLAHKLPHFPSHTPAFTRRA